eukprot:942882-Amphidinium_carterae.1
MYAELEWCSDQSPDWLGRGWKSSLGTLESFAMDGISARTACCICGGGQRSVDALFQHDDLTTNGEWHILDGECTIDHDGCVQSPHYPGDYSDSSSCKIAAPSADGPAVQVEAFSTEKLHDVLVVNYIRSSMRQPFPIEEAQIGCLRAVLQNLAFCAI